MTGSGTRGRIGGTALGLTALAVAWSAAPAVGAGPPDATGPDDPELPSGSVGAVPAFCGPASPPGPARPTPSGARPGPALSSGKPGPGAGPADSGGTASVLEAGPPDYYAFSLVATGRIPGSGRARGRGHVVFPSSSPFGVALSGDGSYRYEMRLSVDGLPDAGARRYVVWLTTPGVDRIRRVGALPADGRIRGSVSWNKFLVVVTLEPPAPASTAGTDGSGGARMAGTDGGSASASRREGGRGGRASADSGWSGPIVLRGMSRSGMMHTMAGHGPFEQENCAAYGYD